MVAVDALGTVQPLYLHDLKGPDGRIRARMVNMESQSVQSVYDNLHYLETEDLESAGTIIKNAERYVFQSILNW